MKETKGNYYEYFVCNVVYSNLGAFILIVVLLNPYTIICMLLKAEKNLYENMRNWFGLLNANGCFLRFNTGIHNIQRLIKMMKLYLFPIYLYLLPIIHLFNIYFFPIFSFCTPLSIWKYHKHASSPHPQCEHKLKIRWKNIKMKNHKNRIEIISLPRAASFFAIIHDCCHRTVL